MSTGYPLNVSSAAAWLDSAADDLVAVECLAVQSRDMGPAVECLAIQPKDTVPFQEFMQCWSEADIALIRERSQPWLEERKDGKEAWSYCKICRNFATDEHLVSKGHLRKLEVQCDYDMQRQATAPPQAWGDPKYFEWRDGWGWWCILCHNWADEGHTVGKKHIQRLEYEQRYPGSYLQWYRNYDDSTDFSWQNSALLVPDEEYDMVGDPWGDRHARLQDMTNIPDPWGPDWDATQRQRQKTTLNLERMTAVDGAGADHARRDRPGSGYLGPGLERQSATSSSRSGKAEIGKDFLAVTGYPLPTTSVNNQVSAASAWVEAGALYGPEDGEEIEWC